MTIKSIMTIPPPRFPPGPVDGAELTAAFVQFQRDVLAKLDLRYVNNDFGGLGTSGQVLTSQGSSGPPNWQSASGGLPSIAGKTILGNDSSGSATATALTGASATALLATFGAETAGIVEASGGGSVNFLRADGTWASPGGGGTTKVTAFDQTGGASQVWTPQAASKWARVICIGGGGGGGSGIKATLSTGCSGGGAGGGGAISVSDFLISALGSSVTITFSNSSTGGAGGAGASGVGAPGTNGSTVNFGALLTAVGGTAGGKGQSSAGSTGGGGAVTGTWQQGTNGGAGTTGGTPGQAGTNNAATALSSTVYPCTGGGGGGGTTSSNTATNGGAGGSITTTATVNGGTAGTGGAGGGNGAASNGLCGSTGGGGGGASVGGTGGQGGQGGNYGGGGGGGGSCTSTGSSGGAGGNGGLAVCIVIEW